MLSTSQYSFGYARVFFLSYHMRNCFIIWNGNDSTSLWTTALAKPRFTQLTWYSIVNKHLSDKVKSNLTCTFWALRNRCRNASIGKKEQNKQYFGNENFICFASLCQDHKLGRKLLKFTAMHDLVLPNLKTCMNSNGKYTVWLFLGHGLTGYCTVIHLKVASVSWIPCNIRSNSFSLSGEWGCA